jgi:type II secretory pathway component PulF
MPEDKESDAKKEYDVTATDMHGKASKSTEEAESVGSLVEELRAGGLQVSAVTGSRGRRLFEPRKCDLEEFAFFNSELASACKRGAPLPGALRALSRDMSGRRVREALEEVASEVEGGTDVADALSRRSDIFPPGYVALVAAGVKSGDLAGTLLLFAEEARFSARVKHKVAAAMVYPLVVLIAASMLLAAMGWMVYPAFETMFKEMGPEAELPGITQLHMDLIPAFKWVPVGVVGLVVVLPLVWGLLSRAAVGAKGAAMFVMRLPIVGRLVRAVAMARFCRTFGSALAGGLPPPEAMTLAGLSTGNAAVQDAAHRARRSIEEGSTVSGSLAAGKGIFPSTIVWMLHIGEQRGELAPALDECARLQEERAGRIGRFLPYFAGVSTIILAALLLMESVIALFMPLMYMGHHGLG